MAGDGADLASAPLGYGTPGDGVDMAAIMDGVDMDMAGAFTIHGDGTAGIMADGADLVMDMVGAVITAPGTTPRDITGTEDMEDTAITTEVMHTTGEGEAITVAIPWPVRIREMPCAGDRTLAPEGAAPRHQGTEPLPETITAL